MDFLVQSGMYISVYLTIICFFSLVVFFYTLCNSSFNETPSPRLNFIAFLFFVIILIFVGFRPISNYFVDMANYYQSFKVMISVIQNGNTLDLKGDYLFNAFMAFFAFLNQPALFFFCCYLIYALCHFFALRKWFTYYWVYPLVLMMSSAFYYNYGVNGIRNGMACSIFLLGLSNQGIRRWLLFLVAFNFHSSLLLPIASVLIFSRYKNIYAYIYIWCACLLISLITPGMTQWLAELSIFNDKFAGYALSNDGRFRVDFILYSVLPIIIGLFFIIKYKFNDIIYNEILSVYMICNAFWLLVIRIPFSNRFVYLSWFMYGLVIAYPFIKSNYFRYQNRYAAFIFLLLLIFNVVFLY